MSTPHTQSKLRGPLGKAGYLKVLVLKVARLPVSLIAGSCVFASLAVLSSYSIPVMALQSLPIVLVTMAAFVLNDLYDVTKDRLAGADKPVALGQVSVTAARLLGVALIAGALVSGALLQQGYSFFVVAAALIAVSLYSPLSHRVPVLKGLAAAVLCCAPLAYASAVTSIQFPPAIYLLLIGFMVGRELLLDVADLQGDLKAGIRTLAAHLGPMLGRSVGWSLMVFSLVALATRTEGTARHLFIAALLSLAAAGAICRKDELRALKWSRLTLLLGVLAVPLSI
jgi:geranylgeranylglycerol-phosphate geranylgeranyltransferase